MKVEEIEPVSNTKNIGFIFYPVESSAYASMAKEIASNGYPVTIVKMSRSLTIYLNKRWQSCRFWRLLPSKRGRGILHSK